MNQQAPLSITGRRWAPPHTASAAPTPSPDIQQLSPWVLSLLCQRGLTEPADIQNYLDTSLAQLEDPASMADMDVAVGRLTQALEKHERVVVYGDYDVDGVCSTTVLVEFLNELGVTVDYYIPDRKTEGYGVNDDAVAEIAKRADLLITTDCGITATGPLTLARDSGIDVIVVDHHQVPEELPPAVALLDPHRPDCSFPFKGLCAAGVAFMLTIALRRSLREQGHFTTRPQPDLRRYLDVVAVATVADMVPLQGNNRVLVAAGLRQMALQQRPGLNALMAVSKIEPRQINASDLGFRLGPRINARGRLDHAGAGVELLLTSDLQRAKELAEILDQANLHRRELEKETVELAITRVEEQSLDARATLVLYDAQWHPGILGLVASRLARRFCRPAVVIGEGGKGSARSIDGVNIHAAMSCAAEHTERFGGHPAAAGLTILPENIPAFHETLEQAVQEQKGAPPFTASLAPDLELDPGSLDLAMVDELDQLAPFGQKNPEPLFLSKGLPVQSRRVVGQTHLKLVLGQARHDAIAFGLGEHLHTLGSHVDVLYRIERNVFRGNETLQLKVEDLRSSPPPLS